MKKIAFIAHAPGSANALFPLIDRLKDKYYIELFPFHKSSSEIFGVKQKELNEFEGIFENDWDLILTGTGSLHEVEKSTPVLAKQNDISVVSILDSWNNYKERYKNKPDYIVCLNDEVKEEILKLGFEDKQVLPFGNPHFDRLKEYKSNKKITSPYNIVFYSTMNKKTKEALKELSLLKLEYPILIKEIYVTPHPREEAATIRKYCEEYKLTFKNYTHSYDLLKETSLSIGFGSTIQYEALMIGKPTIFIEEVEQIKEQFFNGDFDKKIEIDYKATDRVLEFIDNLLK